MADIFDGLDIEFFALENVVDLLDWFANFAFGGDCGGAFVDFEEVEPLVGIVNIDWELVAGVCEDFAAIVSVEVANNNFVVAPFPNNIVIEPIDLGVFGIELRVSMFFVFDVIGGEGFAVREDDDAVIAVYGRETWLVGEFALEDVFERIVVFAVNRIAAVINCEFVGNTDGDGAA